MSNSITKWQSATGNQYGIDELVDTACDIFEVSEQLATAFGNGFQFLQDVPVIIGVSGTAQEIFNDRKQALLELLDTNTVEAAEAERRIVARLKLANATGLRGKIRTGVSLIVRGYQLVDAGKQYFADVVDFTKELRTAA
jgi:hypothetical protein